MTRTTWTIRTLSLLAVFFILTGTGLFAQQGGGFGGYIPPDPAATASTPGQAAPAGPNATEGYIPNPEAAAPTQETPNILPPPFELQEVEQIKLDEFLQHWENFGKGIKRVSCNVHVREFDGGVFNQNTKIPMSHTWGLFRFISPNKLLYHIKGEYSYIADGTEEPKPEWKAGSGEAKIVYDGKSFTQYDFQRKTATVFPLVEEEQDQDLTLDGPFPIFFVANAEKLRSRFYMRIVTPADKVQTDVWIEAWPRYADDAQEFRNIILLLNISDLQPYHMRRTRTNGKSYSDLEFQDVTINKGLWSIDAGVDLGWKKKTEEPISIFQKRPTSAATPASPTP
ncbi:MAG: hypothetical protein Q4G68_03785 [Planctomycetia bacterium]|nr:hypothetical protein [Planctomycetia bacterium]